MVALGAVGFCRVLSLVLSSFFYRVLSIAGFYLALVGFGGFWWGRPENAPVFVGFRFFTRKIHAPYHKTDFPIPKREQHHSIFSLYLGGDRTFLYQGANLSYTTQGTFLYHRPNIPETALFNTKNGSILKRALCYTKNNTTPACGMRGVRAAQQRGSRQCDSAEQVAETPSSR